MSGEMIGTEPSPMSKRQRRWYDKGFKNGCDTAKSAASLAITEARLEARECRMETMDYQRRLENLGHRVAAADKAALVPSERVLGLERDLRFANDRVEQLMNGIVIIQGGKK